MRDETIRPGSPGWQWRGGLAVLAVMGFVTVTLPCWSLPLAGKKPEEFKDAIKAQDRGDWSTSITLMQQALEKQPEDGEQVRIYGTKFKSYLPHYYLGLALYQKGDCAGALREWEECLKTDTVQATGEYQQLLVYRSECRNRS